MTEWKSLSEEMDMLAEEAVSSAQEREAAFAHLYLLGGDGVTMCALSVGNGQQQALVARQLVHIHEPQMAVFECELWCVAEHVPETDPDFRRVALGEITPSMLPPDKRGETLFMYGETREGESQNRMWYIETQKGKRTGLKALPRGTQVHHRFRPLFMAEDMIRELESGIQSAAGVGVVPASIMAAMRAAAEQDKLTADERRFHIRRAVGRILAMGGGTTTQAWTVHRREVGRRAREHIIHSGPAQA